MRTISLTEHASLRVEDSAEAGQLTVSEVEELDAAQKAMGCEAFRWTGRNRIKTCQFVGVIAAPTVRLEILPKMEGVAESENRLTLMRMIAAAMDTRLYDGEITALECQDKHLLELLITLFSHKLYAEVRKGLSHTYVRESNDLNKLRGKLNVVRQITKNIASPQRLACHYDEFTADTPLNRLLLCAVMALTRHTARHKTVRLLREIEAHFENVMPVSVEEALSIPLRLDRRHTRWRSLAELAKLLLQSLYQTMHRGKHNGIALLFDMNALFEAYIAYEARRGLSKEGWRVQVKPPCGYLAKAESGQQVFRTIPDLHLDRDGCVVIIDTKWKHLDSGKKNFGVTQADAYQMHGYAQLYDAASTILLYPHQPYIGTSTGMQAQWQFTAGGSKLAVVTVDITSPKNIQDVLCELVRNHYPQGEGNTLHYERA